MIKINEFTVSTFRLEVKMLCDDMKEEGKLITSTEWLPCMLPYGMNCIIDSMLFELVRKEYFKFKEDFPKSNYRIIEIEHYHNRLSKIVNFNCDVGIN